MANTKRGTWAARLAALLVAVIIPACDNSGTTPVGVSTTSLWSSNAGVGSQPPNTPNFWNNPNTGVPGAGPSDPQDVITYTYPVIYILGLKHPLMTVVTSRNAPNVLFNEDRAMVLLNQFRYNLYLQALGLAQLPGNAKLADHTGLRQNARAHCKHYAVWHPVGALPATNAEGDNVVGRLTKSQLACAAQQELLASGIPYRGGDEVATYWIATFGGTIAAPGPLLGVNWSHLSVGFWQLGGTSEQYYWSCILARDPNTIVVLPTIPFGGPGF